ncbi:serine/threonine-protein kinase [Streptomyces caatingaensis]|uniref:non-specific serine/threonine protein kinase n=1 Tax=Streptomyces caatingaensis TaxID=1678637 RepID=A0A0K9XJY2_9ACTN|nr:serine/threonine-protein kinase [Streptomyces caatingaensis]KNB53628.1 hypothetical protein AC230_03110 [Streptomyces caatingaensis]
MDESSVQLGAGVVLQGRFELEESIGKGGMARVWRAVDRATGRRVAVKFLRMDTEEFQHLDLRERREAEREFRGRFRREAALLGQFVHPGITELIAQGMLGDLPYFVMRLVEGVTLHDFLKRQGALALPVALSCAVQVARALACAHAHLVVHRDLKPYNIMIAEDGTVVLLDFGIAKPLSGEATQYTRRGSTLGSGGYQAPEQILSRKVSTRSDIYSLGCVCYKMLTGRAPFISLEGSLRALQDLHLYAAPSPLRSRVAGVPAEVDDLVLRMLAKGQNERPDIDEVLAVLSPLTPSPGDPEPRPLTHPDLTLPFRRPGDGRPAERVRPPAKAVEEWLDRRMIERTCRTAREEIDEGDPGAAVGELAELAPRVRKEWGFRSALVRQVWNLAAEGLRIAGKCGAAAELYDGIAEDLVRGEGPKDRADRAVARLRAAECRLVDYDLGGALAVLADTEACAGELPPELAERVEAVRQELQLDVNERCDPPAGTS